MINLPIKIKLSKGQIEAIKSGKSELCITNEQVNIIYEKALQLEEEKYNS